MGVLVRSSAGGDQTAAFGAVPSAVGNGLHYLHETTGGSVEQLCFLSVVAGRLAETVLGFEQFMASDPPTRTATHVPLGGRGWGTYIVGALVGTSTRIATIGPWPEPATAARYTAHADLLERLPPS
jgi:hypothetical protein